MQTVKDSLSEKRVLLLNYQCVNASSGIKVIWSWGARITIGNTNLASMAGKKVQPICGHLTVPRPLFSTSIDQVIASYTLQ